MSFLDNLENNLKALEGREEGGADDRARRDADLKDARAAAPWAEKLKNNAWTKNLMGLATRAGFERRIKVNLVWIGTTLRLETRTLRLELRPTAVGVRCVSLRGNIAIGEQILDLENEPAQLLKAWMKQVDEQLAADAAAAAAEVPEEIET